MKAFLTSSLLILFLFASCQESLELNPFDQIDEERAFESLSDLRLGATGVYSGMSGVNVISLNARIADNSRIATTNTGQGIQIFNHAFNAGTDDIEELWFDFYNVIDRANRVLTAKERLEFETEAEQSEADLIEGEMLAVRAWQHFELYRMFVRFTDSNALALPYMQESVISFPERLDQTTYLSLLISDLERAETLLSEQLRSQDKMSLTTVHALRARIALYLENWQEAIDYSSLVIDEVELTSIDDFPNLWNDSENGEILFRLNRAVPADGTVQVWERTGNEDVFFLAALGLVDLFNPADDVRYPVYFQQEEEGLGVGKYNQRSDKNLADIKLFRVSEQYLIRAEAHANLGNLDEASQDIQSLLEQRLFTPIVVDYQSQNEAISDILLQRRKELAYEGHRYFDLKRLENSFERDPRDLNRAVSTGLSANDPRFNLPIPQDEVFANPNMQQNEGYN